MKQIQLQKCDNCHKWRKTTIVTKDNKMKNLCKKCKKKSRNLFNSVFIVGTVIS